MEKLSKPEAKPLNKTQALILVKQFRNELRVGLENN